MQLSQNEAQLLVGFITSVIAPFVTSWIKNDSWSKWLRFLTAVIVSIIGGTISAYATNTLNTESVLFLTLGIFTAAQTWYVSWYKGLGLEDVINPPK